MQKLNLPEMSLNIRRQDGRDYIFDPLRRRFVHCTPEEFVRQTFISFLVNCLNYPEGRLANEVCIVLGNTKKRCDTVVYDEYLQPVMIIEYKAPTVEISQDVFDQIARYNMTLNVPWLVVTNGIRHFCCHVNRENRTHKFETEIPEYDRLFISQ
jgi:hypothetical protein